MEFEEHRNEVEVPHPVCEGFWREIRSAEHHSGLAFVNEPMMVLECAIKCTADHLINEQDVVKAEHFCLDSDGFDRFDVVDNRWANHVTRVGRLIGIASPDESFGNVPGVSSEVSTPMPGPISAAITSRAPFGPIERLSSQRLREEQLVSLAAQRRKPSRSARGLFIVMDLAYGKERTLEKFRVLELVARVPYQAWENVAYVAVTHTASEPGFARRVFDRVRVNRWEQDNEQWHLFILEELLGKRPPTIGWFRAQLLPQLMAFGYYQFSWLTYALKPAWSYQLNIDFEAHAEREYALFVGEHPEWETTPFESSFVEDFGQYASLADVFRQIGYDERLHKLESEAAMPLARFE